MNIKGIKASCMAAIASFTVALAPVAEARTAGAYGFAKSAVFADGACFSEWFDATINNCTANKRITLPSMVDGGNQWYGVIVNARGAGPANNVGCYAQSVTKDINTFWASATVYLSMFGPAVDIGPLWTWVPQDGTLHTYCFVDPGAQVNSYRW